MRSNHAAMATLAVVLALLVMATAAAAAASAASSPSPSSAVAAAAAQVHMTPMLRADTWSSLLRGARHMALTPLSFGVTPQNISDIIRERFGSSSKVDEVRKSIPRWGGPDSFQPEESDYQKEIVSQLAPGAALLVVTLISWVVYSIAQCCCCRSKVQGYTRRERLVPLVLGSLFALVIVAFALIGCFYTEEFDKELSGSSGLTRTSNLVLVHVSDFFTRMQTEMDHTGALVTAIAGQGGEIEQKVNAFPSLGRGLPGFLSDMTAFGNNVASRSPLVVQQVDPTPPATDPLSISCPFCTELQTSLNSAVRDMDSLAMPVYNQIESSKSAALTEIVNVNQEIQTRIGEARTQVADINDKATRYNDKVVEYTDYVDKYEKIRRPIVLVLFLVPLLLSLLWFILVVGARKEFGGKVIVHLLFPFGLLVFVIFMVHLPFSLLIADSCHYLDEKEPALASVSSFEPIVADTLTACMARQNLLSALGVADDLDFTNKIAFPTVPSVDGLLDAQRLRDLDSQVQSASLSSFPDYNPAEKGAQLDALNGITNASPYGDYFTFQNVSACTPVKYVASVVEVKQRRNAVLTALRAEEQINTLLGELQGNMTALMSEFDGLCSTTQTLLLRMGELNTTVTPLLDAAQAVVDIAYCSPLDEDYLKMKQTYCDKMIVSVSALAMASFFVGVFMFLLNVALWFLVYRLQHGAETVAHSAMISGGGGNDLYGAPAGVGVTVGAGSTLMASPTPMIASPSGLQMGGGGGRGAFSPSGDRSLELAQVPVQVYDDQMPGRTNDF